MHFAIHCLDVADRSVRQAHYPEHRAYLASSPIKILVAGPILDEDGETPIGSVLIVEAEDIEAARAFAKNDPFAVHGAWERIQVWPFKKSVDNR
ncbi:YciI family protein [Methylobacterium cerastii]|nr:YciI family protein [Methylobacterium cerastii]